MTTDIKTLARRRIAERVRRGSMPPAVDLPCAKCGAVWDGGKERFAYHHHKGYDGENAGIVEPLCPSCHRKEHPAPPRTASDVKVHSLRLSDDVWGALQASEFSANQLLAQALSSDVRPAKPKTKRTRMVEALKASDPMSSERPEIEYGSDELPSGGSVAVVGAAKPVAEKPKTPMADWRAGRKPLLKQGNRK